MKLISTRAVLVLVLAAFACVSSRAVAANMTSGHADFGIVYSDGEISLLYHIGSGAVVDGVTLTANAFYAPDELTIILGGSTTPRPLGASWDFTGTTAGSTLWYIPQTQDLEKPWLGFARDQVSTGDIPAGNIRFELTAFSGPGHLSLTSTGSFGAQNVHFQTANGVSSADFALTPSHSHYNWFFTAPGTYQATITATTTTGPVLTTTETVTINVVPEPSVTLLGVAGAAFLALRRRRQLA